MPILRKVRSHPPRSRQGAILAVALVALSFVILLTAALTHAVVLFHRQAQLGERRQQALLLAESGLQRGARAAAASKDYAGETWNISAEELGNGAAGIVVIRVEQPDAGTTRRRVFTEARYPDQGTPSFVYRRELLVDLPVPPAPAAINPANPSS